MQLLADSSDCNDKVFAEAGSYLPKKKKKRRTHTFKLIVCRDVHRTLHSPEFQYPPMVQHTSIQPRVSYLTTLNNVYNSETDNTGTPDTESSFIPSGPVSITGPSDKAEQARSPPH